MQSMRGLRRAIPSTSPRYAFIYCSSRSFINSIIRCSIIQQSPSVSDAERVDALRGTTKDQLKKTTRENHVYTREEVKATVDDVDGRKTTKSDSEDASIPQDPAERSHKTRDLCGSVTATMAKLPHPAVVVTTLDRTYHAQAAAGVPIEAMRHPIARGITVSSFTSLCIRPRPHVMFNMTLPSTMYEALVSCKDFNVHVLTPDKHGARVASVFTRGNRLPSPPVGGSENSTYAFDIDADLGVFVGLKDQELRHVEIANRDAWHEQYQDAKESGLQVSGSSHDVDPVAQDPKVAKSIRQVHHVPCLHSKGILEVLHCRLARTIHPELPNAGQNVVIIGEVVDATYPSKSKEERDRTPIALGYADRKYRSIGGAIHPHETDGLEDEP
ncbi:flavin reductase like domain-containing protein [Xylaria castorea]|nr:flavin reductase like domain-containing protein [Xylaria castorea]